MKFKLPINDTHPEIDLESIEVEIIDNNDNNPR